MPPRTTTEPVPGGPARARMFLVDDEVVTVTYKGKPADFRVRIWRARDRPAVVLVSRRPGGPPPSAVSAKLASLVLRAYLGYGPMHYVEQDRKSYRWVKFESLGHRDRMRLTTPCYGEVARAAVEALVGESVG